MITQSHLQIIPDQFGKSTVLPAIYIETVKVHELRRLLVETKTQTGERLKDLLSHPSLIFGMGIVYSETSFA